MAPSTPAAPGTSSGAPEANEARIAGATGGAVEPRDLGGVGLLAVVGEQEGAQPLADVDRAREVGVGDGLWRSIRPRSASQARSASGSVSSSSSRRSSKTSTVFTKL